MKFVSIPPSTRRPSDCTDRPDGRARPPAIVGHGIDVVSTERIASLIGEHGERALAKLFTTGERAYADASAKRRHEHLAARFAAKEAVLKALGTGLTCGIAWTEIEVVSDEAGKPGLILSGIAAGIAGRLGVEAWHLSLTHDSSLAFASVIAVASADASVVDSAEPTAPAD